MLSSASNTKGSTENVKQEDRHLTPIDLPELLQIVNRELTHRDRIACMLVCKAWRRRFEELVWYSQVYNRIGIPGMESKGHLINTLTAYFPLDNHHLNLLASYCPNIVKLNLEISPKAGPNVIDSFMASMSNMQDLTVKLGDRTTSKFLCSLTRMPNLRSLRITGGKTAGVSKDILWIISLLQSLPMLESFSIDACLKESLVVPLEVKEPIRGLEYNAAARPLTWGQWFLSMTGQTNESPEVLKYRRELEKARRKEPWRKFLPIPPPSADTEPVEALLEAAPPIPESYDLLNRALIPGQPIANLTRLVLFSTAAKVLPQIADSLFPLLPSLKEVSINCSSVFGRPSLGLAHLAEHCRALQSIRLECITLKVPTLSSHDPTLGSAPVGSTTTSTTVSSMETDLVSFFSNMPPRIRSLSLVDCAFIDVGYLDIPVESLQLLSTLEIVNNFVSQRTLHGLLVRCPRLTTLTIGLKHDRPPYATTWSSFNDLTTLAVLGRNDHFLGSMLQPWECTWTLRQVNVDQWHIVEMEAFEALFGRIEAMPCLTSLSLSTSQIYMLIEESMRNQIYRGGNSSMTKNIHNNATVVEQAVPVRWSFVSLLDLRIATVKSYVGMYAVPNVRPLDVNELKCLLMSMPKLRRMWYVGTTFPFDKKANTWLQDARKDLSIRYYS